MGMGFVRSWEVLTVLRALLGIFEAGRKWKIFEWESRLIGDSLSWRCVHHRLVVSTIRDGEASVDILYGGIVGFGIRTNSMLLWSVTSTN